MGLWWQEEVDSARFVKLFVDGMKKAAGLWKLGIPGLRAGLANEKPFPECSLPALQACELYLFLTIWT
jgi:hypothetical protein